MHDALLRNLYHDRCLQAGKRKYARPCSDSGLANMRAMRLPMYGGFNPQMTSATYVNQTAKNVCDVCKPDSQSDWTVEVFATVSPVDFR